MESEIEKLNGDQLVELKVSFTLTLLILSCSRVCRVDFIFIVDQKKRSNVAQSCCLNSLGRFVLKLHVIS